MSKEDQIADLVAKALNMAKEDVLALASTQAALIVPVLDTDIKYFRPVDSVADNNDWQEVWQTELRCIPPRAPAGVVYRECMFRSKFERVGVPPAADIHWFVRGFASDPLLRLVLCQPKAFASQN